MYAKQEENMRVYALIALLSFTGCNGVDRLIGQQPRGQMPEQNNINPDDYVKTGITSIVDDVVYLGVKGRTISVEILRNGAWVTLRGDYVDYIAFVMPDEGVRFWNGSTPAGTQYRIHSVKKAA